MKSLACFYLSLVTLLLLSLLSPSVLAFGYEDDPSSGILNLQTAQGTTSEAPILDTKVSMSIAGLSARVKVVQRFSNNSALWVEGVYLFPLPEKSAVDTLSMKIGTRVIVGEIKEKKIAKQLYQQAKISGKKVSLVEQHRPNIFSNKVANIAPFETIEITIEYQQQLSYSRADGFGIRFPMTITPRYTPAALLVENFANNDHFTNGFQLEPSFLERSVWPQQKAAEPGNDVTINVSLSAGMPLASVVSSSHQIDLGQQSTTDYEIALAAGINKADRDFILSWKPLPGAEPRAAMFSETIEDERFVSIMLMPPIDNGADNQAGNQTDNHHLAREVIFVLDTSGSMAGESIKQAKSALLFGLDTLSNGDQFNIIEFNSDTHQLYPEARAFDKNSQRQAMNFISGLSANGGTEMLKAMDAALTGQSKKHQSSYSQGQQQSSAVNRVRQVIFLTDGAINNESQLFQKIENLLGDSRLFTVGIGSAPNEFFMNRAALFGHGRAIFIKDINQSEEKIRQLFSQIQQPVLSHIEVNWPDSLTVEMWPQKIPDLLAGEPLWIKAKITALAEQGDPLATLSINGRMSNGLWQTNLALTRGNEQAGIAKLWAREKIASIMNQSHHGQLNTQQQQQVTEVALKHHLVSRFTSLVAIDKTPTRLAETLHQAQVKSTQPKGAASSQVSYPKTAINLHLSPFWSLLLLLISGMGYWLLHRFDAAECRVAES